MPATYPVKTDEDRDDVNAPYNEIEAFNSIWDALRWKHVRKRVPVCLKKTLYNRYMLANLIYLGYTIALLILDFHPDFSPTDTEISNQTSLDQPVMMNEYANRIYIGKSCDSFFIDLNRIITFVFLRSSYS
jgi:hypothetical protein